MRSMLLSIMFCLISSVIWGDSVSWADLVENSSDGLVYQKFQTMPFTGTVAATADNPIQRLYKNGVKHGAWVEFNSNGLVKTKSKFENGKIQRKVGFKNGKETIEEKYDYHESGQLEPKTSYKDGKENGPFERYYENGQLETNGNFKDGLPIGLVEVYYKSGQLHKKVNVKDGEPHGLEEQFNEDGSLKSSTTYQNGAIALD